MGKASAPSISIPQYQEPAKVNFNTPYGNAIFDKGTNSYNFQETQAAEADRLELEALRNSILKTIGVTSPEREASRQNFVDTYFKEASRLAVPQLENTLFDRGLGGSRLYGQSLIDLNSQLATDAVLQGEALRTQDENMKLTQLQSVNNSLNQQNALPLSLLSLAGGYNNTATAQAQQQYQALLPYTSVVNPGKQGNLGTLIGAGAGGLGGFFIGGPAGAVQGAQLGSQVGSIFN